MWCPSRVGMQGVHPVLYAQALKHWRKAGRRSETCEIKLLIYTGDISEVPKRANLHSRAVTLFLQTSRGITV